MHHQTRAEIDLEEECFAGVGDCTKGLRPVVVRAHFDVCNVANEGGRHAADQACPGAPATWHTEKERLPGEPRKGDGACRGLRRSVRIEEANSDELTGGSGDRERAAITCEESNEPTVADRLACIDAPRIGADQNRRQQPPASMVPASRPESGSEPASMPASMKAHSASQLGNRWSPAQYVAHHWRRYESALVPQPDPTSAMSATTRRRFTTEQKASQFDGGRARRPGCQAQRAPPTRCLPRSPRRPRPRSRCWEFEGVDLQPPTRPPLRESTTRSPARSRYR